jgi:hypothetical protein
MLQKSELARVQLGGEMAFAGKNATDGLEDSQEKLIRVNRKK